MVRWLPEPTRKRLKADPPEHPSPRAGRVRAVTRLYAENDHVRLVPLPAKARLNGGFMDIRDRRSADSTGRPLSRGAGPGDAGVVRHLGVQLVEGVPGRDNFGLGT